jgi:hypothetical protein
LKYPRKAVDAKEETAVETSFLDNVGVFVVLYCKIINI